MRHRFMLDTNTLSEIISDRSGVVRSRFRGMDIRTICVSAITRGEIAFGISKQPEATRRARVASRIFDQVPAIPWTAMTALRYGVLRARMEREGKSLGPLDMLIAAHALEIGATLVTADRAFRFVPDLASENWLSA